MARCLSVVELADYVSGDETHRPHVTECARCRSIATALQGADGLSNPEAAVAEIEKRQALARSAVAELEARLPHLWQSAADADHRLKSPEAVRRLLDRAVESLQTTSRRALALAQVAVSCSRSNGIPGSLRFEAFKELARCSLVAGDLSGALHALDAAEAVLPHTDDPVLSEAVLDQARAYVYGHPSCAQWDGALSLLDVCEPVLAGCDRKRWRGARHLRAAILIRRADYREAAALYRELLANENDRLTRAHLTKDLAECLCRMGPSAEALPLATEALHVLARTGHNDTIARALWIHGHALSAVGRHDEAIRTLSKVAEMFASSGQYDDELGAELDTIHTILARDPAADVADRLETAYLLACALDAAEPLRSGAQRAALWVALRSAYARRALTPAVLAHASEYLRTLGRADEVPFVPLM